MNVERAGVKAQLLLERRVMRMVTGKLAYVNCCDLCGRLNPTDLHECIISRGKARGNPELEAAVLVFKGNLSLLCNRCNVQLAEMDQARRFLIGKNLDRYQLDPLRVWVRELPFTTQAQGDEYVRLLEDIARDNRPRRWAEEIEPALWNYGERRK